MVITKSFLKEITAQNYYNKINEVGFGDSRGDIYLSLSQKMWAWLTKAALKHSG